MMQSCAVSVAAYPLHIALTSQVDLVLNLPRRLEHVENDRLKVEVWTAVSNVALRL